MTRYTKAQVDKIIKILDKRMASASGKAYDRLERAQRDLRKWNRQSPLPNENFLQELGILDELTTPAKEIAEPVTEASVSAAARETALVSEQQPVEDVPAEDAVPAETLSIKRELDDLHARGKIYEVIKIIEKKAGVGDSDPRLEDLRIELDKGTRKLVAEARRVEKQFVQDLDVQEKAWKAVKEFNPENQEAREALRTLERTQIRRSTEVGTRECLELAEEGARKLDLPQLNQALSKIQALQQEVASDAFLLDMLDTVREAVDKVASARTKTRDVLGVMATAKIEGKWKEAYTKTREFIESPEPPPVAPDLDGHDKPLNDVWQEIRKGFVEWLRTKSSEYVMDAKEVADASPKFAREKLEDALRLLSDSILLPDDAVQLEHEKKQVNNRIGQINKNIERYDLAGKLVVEAQSRELNPRERLKRLQQARKEYKDYPGLDIYIKSAEDDLASTFVRTASETNINAKDLAAQDRYDEAIAQIDATIQSINLAFPSVPEQSRLAVALKQLDDEKTVIQSQKRAYEKMLWELSSVKDYLKTYDSAKDAGALKAARALFADILKESPHHHLVQEMNANLVARQGDPDNWESGENAYRSQNWEAAESALRKISEQYPKHAEAQTLAQRARAAIATFKGREFEAVKDWRQAIDAYQRALYIFDGDEAQGYQAYGTDPETVAFAEESRKALERLRDIHENDKRVDEIIRNCEDLLRSAQRTAQSRRQLVDKVEPIPLFTTIETKLRNALAKYTTTRSERMYELLNNIHDIWLVTYLGGMQLVANQTQKNRTLLRKACALADELDQTGLLVDHEALACQLQADMLDLDFANIGKSGGESELQKMEENRRERLSVQRRWPIDSEHASQHDEKIKELEKSIRELVDRRMKLDLERRVNQALRDSGSSPTEAQAAYETVLRDLEKDERLQGSIGATTSLIRVAWKACEWQRADALARRLRENTNADGVDYVAISDQWLALGRVAQAFATDAIDDGLAYAAEPVLVKNIHKNLREAKAELENEVVARLIKEARDKVASKTDQGYMEAAQKYTLAYKLAPNNSMIVKGLEEVGTNIVENIKTISQAAASLQLTDVTWEDLRKTCKKAREQYSALSDFSKVARHLKLSTRDAEELVEATQKLSIKRKAWDDTEKALDEFARGLEAALNQPEQIDPRTDQGGWQLDEFEQQLQDVRKIARQDVQLSRLVDNTFTEWSYKRDVADRLNKLVIVMMTAVGQEDFDQVIALSYQLEENWKTAQRDGFAGLEIMIYETYRMGTAKTPQEHREMAQRQKANLETWSRWVSGVKDQQKALSGAYRELQFYPGSWRGLSDRSRVVFIDQRFSLESGLGMPLREVIAQAERSREAVAVFQTYYQSRPEVKPASNKADLEMQQIGLSQDEDLHEFLDYIATLKVEAEKRLTELERVFIPQLRALVKNAETLATKDGRVPKASLDIASQQVEKCKHKDPFNRDVANLEQRLNAFGPR